MKSSFTASERGSKREQFSGEDNRKQIGRTGSVQWQHKHICGVIQKKATTTLSWTAWVQVNPYPATVTNAL